MMQGSQAKITDFIYDFMTFLTKNLWLFMPLFMTISWILCQIISEVVPPWLAPQAKFLKIIDMTQQRIFRLTGLTIITDKKNCNTRKSKFMTFYANTLNLMTFLKILCQNSNFMTFYFFMPPGIPVNVKKLHSVATSHVLNLFPEINMLIKNIVGW